MKIFLVWGGEKSREAAKVLYWWLPLIFQDVEPFHSELSTESGKDWSAVIKQELLSSDFGIVAVTPKSLTSQWVHFESGALAKLPESHVVPVLFGVANEQVVGPLNEFQSIQYSKTGFQTLAATINRNRTSPMPESRLSETFEVWWDELNARLTEVIENTELDGNLTLPDRSTPDMVKEVLDLVRSQDRTISQMIGEKKWTFRGNAQLDEFREADFRQLALGLAMLKTIAEIEHKDYYRPEDATVQTLLKLRDPLEVILGRARAPLISNLYFIDKGGKLAMTYQEEEIGIEEDLDGDF